MSSAADLYALQELDSALDASRTALDDVESRLGDSEALAEASVLVDEKREALRIAEHGFREREYETDELLRKLQPVEAKLYQGTVTNPKELEDLQQDVDSLKRRRNTLEDEALAAMETYERAQQELAEAERRFQETEAGFGAEQRELTERRDALRETIDDLERRRDEHASSIDAASLSLYERLLEGRGRRAVAKVVGGACQGCRISLPVHLIQRARGSDLVQCSSCQRILFLT